MEIDAMKIKPPVLAIVCGVIGTVVMTIVARQQYNFAIPDQRAGGLGFIVGGFIGASAGGYLLGKLMEG
jgi:hypothetical protein